MSKAIPVRMSDDLLARVDAWAALVGDKRSPAIIALIETGLRHSGGEEGAPAPAPAPRPKGPVPAMELAREAQGKTEVVKAGPRKVDQAKAILAQAEGKAAHLATARPAGRVNVGAAMDAAGTSGFGERPAYGSRLKGQDKPKPGFKSRR